MSRWYFTNIALKINGRVLYIPFWNKRNFVQDSMCITDFAYVTILRSRKCFYLNRCRPRNQYTIKLFMKCAYNSCGLMLQNIFKNIGYWCLYFAYVMLTLRFRYASDVYFVLLSMWFSSVNYQCVILHWNSRFIVNVGKLPSTGLGRDNIQAEGLICVCQDDSLSFHACSYMPNGRQKIPW